MGGDDVQWFRWDNNARHNRKLRAIPVESRWLYLSLCEMASQAELNGVVQFVPGVKYTDEQLADEAKVDVEAVGPSLQHMAKVGLIEQREDCLFVTAFSERQYRSDASAERTRSYRKRHMAVTTPSQKQPRDCDVTPPDTDTDTDTEKRIQSKVFDEVSDAYRLSKILRDEMLRNNVRAKVPEATVDGMAKWSAEMDRVLRIDKRSPYEAESLIRWCQQDSFWLTNILSPKKFREQYDKLWLRMTKGNSKPAAVSQLPSSATSYGLIEELERLKHRG